MTNAALNILIADDDDGDRKQIKHALKLTGLSYKCVETVSVEEALEACDKCAFDCAIVDYLMPGFNGLEGINIFHERLPYMPVIMITGQGDELVAAEAMKRGALDYIPKTHIHAESIRRIIENAVEKAALRQKVARQQEELESFAGMLVHDLKAPLHSIQNYADYIEENINQGKPEKIVSDCHHVVNAAQRMNTLINTLHEYTRVDAHISLESVEMSVVFENTLSNLEHLILERKARITHGDLPKVTGNAPQLIQLLQNLISNGIKYCEAENPSIHVHASSQGGGSWLFTVKDNGIGIPEQDYKTVFEPFKRLHDTDKYEGTGLGLATCKKIVERHGGRIWCQSKEGQGTIFYFTLEKADNNI